MNHGLFFIIHLENDFRSTPGTGNSKHHFPHFTYLFSRKDAMTQSKSVTFQFSFFIFHFSFNKTVFDECFFNSGIKCVLRFEIKLADHFGIVNAPVACRNFLDLKWAYMKWFLGDPCKQ